MIGNGSEWCRDNYCEYDGTTVRPGDGLRITDEADIVFRGGNCMFGSKHARSAMRWGCNPEQGVIFWVGLRPAARLDAR